MMIRTINNKNKYYVDSLLKNTKAMSYLSFVLNATQSEIAKFICDSIEYNDTSDAGNAKFYKVCDGIECVLLQDEQLAGNSLKTGVAFKASDLEKYVSIIGDLATNIQLCQCSVTPFYFYDLHDYDNVIDSKNGFISAISGTYYFNDDNILYVEKGGDLKTWMDSMSIYGTLDLTSDKYDWFDYDSALVDMVVFPIKSNTLPAQLTDLVTSEVTCDLAYKFFDHCERKQLFSC